MRKAYKTKILLTFICVLILIQALKPKMIAAINLYVLKSLGATVWASANKELEITIF